MSSNVIWEPTNRKADDLSTELKFALRKRYKEPINIRMDYQSLPYLQGLVDGGMTEAQKLIDAIEKHEEIDVYEKY